VPWNTATDPLERKRQKSWQLLYIVIIAVFFSWLPILLVEAMVNLVSLSGSPDTHGARKKRFLFYEILI
jgi:hypothetical protein